MIPILQRRNDGVYFWRWWDFCCRFFGQNGDRHSPISFVYPLDNGDDLGMVSMAFFVALPGSLAETLELNRGLAASMETQ